MRCLLMGLMLLALLPDRARGCEHLSLNEVPRPARATLKNIADPDALARICRVPLGERASAYRVHGRASGITVEVSESGRILSRAWSQ